MNFLSHFYFDRYTADPKQVIGMVLPDLLKNANKHWNIRPEKNEGLYLDSEVKNIYWGWKRHIWVDKYFHCSGFFFKHTQEIRTRIFPFLETAPARPFFVAHIALELMLDSLLLNNNLLNTSHFYTHLENTNKEALTRFFNMNDILEQEPFFHFLNGFIGDKYLNSYISPDKLVYAIHRICMRIWDQPFNETQKLQLAEVLIEYQESLQKDFMSIFEDIEKKLLTFA